MTGSALNTSHFENQEGVNARLSQPELAQVEADLATEVKPANADEISLQQAECDQLLLEAIDRTKASNPPQTNVEPDFIDYAAWIS